MKIQIDADEKDTSHNRIENYKICIPLSSDTQVVRTLSEDELKTLLDEITTVLGYKEIMEKFQCSVQEAREIKQELNYSSDCRDCDLKMRECYRCLKVCQSPLEQTLLKALAHNNIQTELQLRINKDNTVIHFPEPVDPAKILTLPDFYIETENKKICVYTDGHSYHERTEYQAVRDRSIDRELQNLGYVVLRYTSSEIRNDLDAVVRSIKRTMGIIPEDEDHMLEAPAAEEKTEGTCIRCGDKIPYSPNYPLCEDCYRTWAEFGNADYTERFCHKCGREFDSGISYGHPLCKFCR